MLGHWKVCKRIFCCRFDAENYPSNITLTSEAPQSRMFQGIDPVLQTAMQNQSILMQNHVNGENFLLFPLSKIQICLSKGLDVKDNKYKVILMDGAKS